MNYFQDLSILQPIIHYGLHFVFPGLIAFVFFRQNWKKVWAIMLLTMLVDIDHLLSTPIYSPERCSIGHHILHSYYMIAVYFLIMFIPKTRIIGIGLTFHMITDGADCNYSEIINYILK